MFNYPKSLTEKCGYLRLFLRARLDSDSLFRLELHYGRDREKDPQGFDRACRGTGQHGIFKPAVHDLEVVAVGIVALLRALFKYRFLEQVSRLWLLRQVEQLIVLVVCLALLA